MTELPNLEQSREHIGDGVDFADIVHDSHNRWREAKQPSWKEFSQAVDIPESLSGRFVDTMIDNMPSYIPEDVCEALRERHPEPILAVGVLLDKRMFSDLGDKAVERVFPSNLESDEDREAWNKGITLLDEIANDTLSQDILLEIGRSEEDTDSSRWFAPLITVLRKYNPIKNAYKGVLNQAEESLGGGGSL